MEKYRKASQSIGNLEWNVDFTHSNSRTTCVCRIREAFEFTFRAVLPAPSSRQKVTIGDLTPSLAQTIISRGIDFFAAPGHDADVRPVRRQIVAGPHSFAVLVGAANGERMAIHISAASDRAHAFRSAGCFAPIASRWNPCGAPSLGKRRQRSDDQSRSKEYPCLHSPLINKQNMN